MEQQAQLGAEITMEYINKRINDEYCDDTAKLLTDEHLMDEYKKSTSVRNEITKLSDILDSENISEESKQSNMKGEGRKFNQHMFEEKTRKLIFIIVSNIDFPNIKIKFISGNDLILGYPKGKIPFKDFDKFFNYTPSENKNETPPPPPVEL